MYGGFLQIGRTGILRIPAAVNQAITAIQPDRKVLLPEYLIAVLNCQVDYWKAVASSSRKDPNITSRDIKAFPIAAPPFQEQLAIAVALGEMDALIASLDRLIAKKRDIKQAAMQQLLTGRTRLPGFSGQWKARRLGDVGRLRGGNGFPTIYQGHDDGDFPFFKVSDMNNDGNSVFMVRSNNRITETVREELGATSFPRHSIVFAKIGAAIFLERKKILSQSSCIDNNMMGFIIEDKDTHYRFMHYLLLTVRFGNLVSTTALPSLNGKEIADLEFALPPLKEQTAIAEVLTDIDSEIAALENRRDKTCLLKQRMMQELLTGKVRLV